MYESHQRHRHLPRLAPEFYRGFAVVHWIMAVNDRKVGWLTTECHARLREELVHAMVRYCVLSPAYCLMPDHAHVIWMGIAETADLRKAVESFRRHSNTLLAHFQWQQQAYDHVLREGERRRGAFAEVCRYVLENPVRQRLCDSWRDYPFSGAILPGYSDVEPRRQDFWEVFWKIYAGNVIRNTNGTPKESAP